MSCLRYAVYRWCIITLIIAHVSLKNVMRHAVYRWCIFTLIIAHVSLENVTFETRRVSLCIVTLIIALVSHNVLLQNVTFETHHVSLCDHHAHYRSCLAQFYGPNTAHVTP